MIILDETLVSHFGNINTKTLRTRLTGLPWPAGLGIARIRPTLQGSADEPLAVSSMFMGKSGADAAVISPAPVKIGGQAALTVPQGAEVQADWIEVNWTSAADITFSWHCNGGAGADKVTANSGTAHSSYLRIGDYAGTPSGDGFSDFPGYHSLVSEIEIETFELPPPPEPGAITRKLISGLHPLLLLPYQVFVTSGVCAVSGDTPDALIDIPDTLIDARNVGPWGTTTPFGTGWWHMWGIYSTATGQSAMILSLQELSSPFFSELQAVAPEFDRIRKLPAIFRCLDAQMGFEDAVLSSWPWPAEWIHQGSTSARDISFTDATQFIRKDIRPLIPRTARFVMLDITGNGWVRTPGKGDGGPEINGQARRIVACSSQTEIEGKGNMTCRVQGWRVVETY